MWRHVDSSVRGTSHEATGAPCQDYCAGRVVPTPGGPVLVVAVADGAGSASHSEVGARLAAETFVERAEAQLMRSPTLAIESLYDDARARVVAEAQALGVAPRELACTLLSAVVGPGWAAFAQVGDGAIVFDGPEGHQLAFWPDNGEYANTTRFLTDADHPRHLRVDRLDRPVAELALLSDGIQMLALDYTNARVHGAFFAPMFRTLRDAPDLGVLHASLAAFLGSPRVNGRTDDDKTLFLATRDPEPVDADDAPDTPA